MKESSFAIRDQSEQRSKGKKRGKTKKLEKKGACICIQSCTNINILRAYIICIAYQLVCTLEYIAYMFVCIGAKYFINVILCILYSREYYSQLVCILQSTSSYYEYTMHRVSLATTPLASMHKKYELVYYSLEYYYSYYSTTRSRQNECCLRLVLASQYFLPASKSLI